MKRTIITTGFVVVLTTIALMIFVRLSSGNGKQELNLAEVKRGGFEIVVSNSGELLAEFTIISPVDGMVIYKKDRMGVKMKTGTRQIVVPGESNDKNIIIEQGLVSGTSVWLSTPENPGKFVLAGNELISTIKEREKARKLEMESKRKENVLITESRSGLKVLSSGSGQSGPAGTVGGF